MGEYALIVAGGCYLIINIIRKIDCKIKILKRLKVRIFIGSKSVHESVCNKDSIYNLNHLCNIHDHSVGSSRIGSNIISLYDVLCQNSCSGFAYRLSLYITNKFIIIKTQQMPFSYTLFSNATCKTIISEL